MISIFIPSYNRASTCTTPQLLEECGVIRYKIIVRKSQFAAYAAAGHPKHNLMVLPGEGDLTEAREYARRSIRKGEWCLHMDDNVRGFIMPKRGFYTKHSEVKLAPGETMITRAKWQPTMNVDVDFARFYDLIVEDTLLTAEKRGANLAGFSAHENPAFRARKYTDVGYVCGKAMLMKNVGLPWKQSTESAGEDYALTAAHLWDDGRVLVNKWGHPRRVHYQPGGCGPYEERLPAMLRAQKELVDRYGNLFGIKNASNPDKKQGELRIRFNSLTQVKLWRDGHRGGVPVTDPNWR